MNLQANSVLYNLDTHQFLCTNMKSGIDHTKCMNTSHAALPHHYRRFSLSISINPISRVMIKENPKCLLCIDDRKGVLRQAK